MNIEKFNYFYRTNIRGYEILLSSIKLSNNIFSQQEKVFGKVYLSPANLVNPNPEDIHSSFRCQRYFYNNGLYVQSLKMIEYFGINEDNPIPKCDLKAFILSENISKNTKGRLRHFYDILRRIHNETERFKQFKFAIYPESLF